MSIEKERINAVATMAARMGKKPKSEHVFDIVKSMIGDGAIQGKDAATLYAYFIPASTKGKTVKTPEQWVMLAMGVNDVRNYLNFAYSDGENLVATDGHRLHMMPTKLPTGFYDRNMAMVTVNGNFPNYQRIIPDATRMTEYSADIKELKIDAESKRLVWYMLPCGAQVQKKYLDDAIQKDEQFKYLSNGPGNAILLQFDDGRKAVIMPRRVQKTK